MDPGPVLLELSVSANLNQEFIIYKYKEKLVILQSIGIIVIKSKEARMITYTCRYSSGHLIPNSS